MRSLGIDLGGAEKPEIGPPASSFRVEGGGFRILGPAHVGIES